MIMLRCVIWLTAFMLASVHCLSAYSVLAAAGPPTQNPPNTCLRVIIIMLPIQAIAAVWVCGTSLWHAHTEF
jgi:hypothetical protein